MSKKKSIDFQQTSFLDNETIVNVASVPQRSPFRYPGGKTWLIPKIRKWLVYQSLKPEILVEPFAGGGIVGLTAAAEFLTHNVVMAELDELVAAVWITILQDEGGGEWLADQISSFELNSSTLNVVLQAPPLSIRDIAFKTILRNRVSRGGILAPGAGYIKTGENGKGLLSRWYPETLKKRILEIIPLRDHITFVHGDGLKVMEKYKELEHAVFFIDPPYTVSRKGAGKRLYTHSQLDHEALFQMASRCRGDFLMTYDNAEEVRLLADRYGFDTELVAMKNTHHAAVKELLIARNFDWLRK